MSGVSDAAGDVGEGRGVEVCLNCGYSLRGLAREGRCPECGEDYPAEGVVLVGREGRWGSFGLWTKVILVYAGISFAGEIASGVWQGAFLLGAMFMVFFT